MVKPSNIDCKVDHHGSKNNNNNERTKYRQVEELLLGLHRRHIDGAAAMKILLLLNVDPIALAFRAIMLDPYIVFLGVPKDLKESRRLWRTSMEHGLEEIANNDDEDGSTCYAHYFLGIAYFEGLGGLATDCTKGVNYLESSAESAYPALALSYLAFVSETGALRVDVNLEEAVNLYRLAAETHGSAHAQFRLGLLYRDGGHGDGVSQSCKRAKYYLNLASKQKNTAALIALGDLYLTMDENEGENDDVAAVNCYRLAVELGDQDGNVRLGDLYNDTDNKRHSPSKAFRYFRVAAEQKNPDAQVELAEFLSAGCRGIERDQDKAVGLYTSAAHQGQIVAQCRLGFMYSNGENGVEENDEKAAYFFKLAADNESTSRFRKGFVCVALKMMGLTCLRGRGVDVDYEKAVLYYERAVDLLESDDEKRSVREVCVEYLEKKVILEDGNSTAASFQLGRLYSQGKFVNKSVKAARKIFEDCARQGNVQAQRCLRLTDTFLFVAMSIAPEVARNEHTK